MGVVKSTMKDAKEEVFKSQMQLAMRQREMMMAVELARARDNLRWYAAFASTIVSIGIAAFVVKRNPATLMPIIPFSFGGAFQYDFCYGNKLIRVREQAGEILNESWQQGDSNPFLLPENNMLLDRVTYESFLDRNKQNEKQ
eukprot:TRINITY_DN420_c0_g2_i1.p1 TRINITY_DN420_c0_g2~~TRINITY_DN420_c0_g2_i1.p1  ORF type:complete len:142 (+),score=32.54 TRINITY_DN420_c0_g2_i1:68-493(+)